MSQDKSKQAGHFGRNKIFYIFIGILILTVAGVYFIEERKINELNKKHQERVGFLLDSVMLERSDFMEYTTEFFEASNQEQLGLMLKTFVWAVRAEILKNNYDQIDQYITQLIREPSILKVMLIDSKGTVLVSSDRKDQDQPFSDLFDDTLLFYDDAFTNYAEDGNMHLSAPIMSLNSRFGTLFVVYEPSALPELNEDLKITTEGN